MEGLHELREVTQRNAPKLSIQDVHVSAVECLPIVDSTHVISVPFLCASARVI